MGREGEAMSEEREMRGRRRDVCERGGDESEYPA